MKNALLLLAALSATTGCVMTLAEVRQEVVPTQATMARPPMGAASCVARNIENTADLTWGVHPGYVREGNKPGTAELSVPPALAADFEPSGNGSTATIYVSPNLLSVYTDRYLGAFKGC